MKKLLNRISRIFTTPIFFTGVVLVDICSILMVGYRFVVIFSSQKWSVSAIVCFVTLVFLVILLLSLFYKLSSSLTDSYAVLQKMSSNSERILDIVEKIRDYYDHPLSLATLRDIYLTKLSVFLYYVDAERIDSYYRTEFGLDEQTSEVEESVKTTEAGIKGSAGNLLSASHVLGKQSKSTKESKVFPKSMEEKVIDWQSAFLRKGIITVGLEYTLTQIAQDFGIETQNKADKLGPNDITITAREEKNRLQAIKGLVLINAPFIIMDDISSIGKYELIYRHPISELNQNPENQFVIRISLLKDQLSRQTILYFQKYINSPIDFYVLGNIVTVKNSVADEPNIIEVFPLAIYT